MNYSLLVVSLIWGTALGSSFVWNKTVVIDSFMATKNIPYVSNPEGAMYIFYERYHPNYKLLKTTRIRLEGWHSELGMVYGDNVYKGFKGLAVQGNDDGKSMLAVFCGQAKAKSADNSTQNHRNKVFFSKSTDGGKNWASAQEVVLENKELNLVFPFSTLYEKNSDCTYAFFAVNTKDNPFYTEIDIYRNRMGENEFERVGTVPRMPNLVSFKVGLTIDNSRAREYFHVFSSDFDNLYYIRSFDFGKTWSNYTVIARNISTGLYNFVAIDQKARANSLYVQYRDKIKKKLYVLRSRNNGDSFEVPILVGDALRPLRDAIGICGIEEDESIVVSAHVDYRVQNSYIKLQHRNKDFFVNIPYPFTDLKEVPRANLMVGCAYGDNRKFSIVFGILTEVNDNDKLIAHGILDLSDEQRILNPD